MSNEADASGGAQQAEDRRRRRRGPSPRRRGAPSRREDDGLAAAARRTSGRSSATSAATEPEPIVAGPSNFSRAQVPWGVDLAAAWAWRFLVIVAAGYVILAAARLLRRRRPPARRRAADHGAGRARSSTGCTGSAAARARPRSSSCSSASAFVAALLTFAGQQVANGANDLADQTVKGLGEIKDWLQTGPLHASDSQINDYIDRAQEAITRSNDGGVDPEPGHRGRHRARPRARRVLHRAVLDVLLPRRRQPDLVLGGPAGAPRRAAQHVDSSGRVAWISLTQFVRATVIVAATDAIGIMIVAAILGVPFVLAIGVLVFLGAFVPMVGATVAGTVAVLVALVDQGPVTALFMLGGVILVQQIEGHVLQPFLMGRLVSVHPLGVIVAIGCGVLVAGIAGALVAVPLAAAGNAVVQHLASYTDARGDDPRRQLEEDYEPRGRRRRGADADRDPRS